MPASQIAPADPRALYQALNDLRPDGVHVYTIKDLNLRRDVVSLNLTDGKLAFLQPLGGHVTGAVFTGHGRVLATPHDRGERGSLARFLGVPILDQTFTRAYFRFTDDTAMEIEQQLRAADASSASDTKFVESWNIEIGALNPWHSLRIMFDWLSIDPMPYFYAGLGSESIGAFDVLVDSRRDEQVLIGQPRMVSAGGGQFYDVWTSFRAADAAKIPGETFVPLDYRVDTTIADDLSLQGTTFLHLKTVRAGERVVPLELSRNLIVDKIQSADGQPLIYFQNEDLSRRDILRRGNDTLLVVIPAPARAGEEIRLQVFYRGSVINDAGNGVEYVGEHGTWYAHVGSSDHFVPFDLSFRWPKRFTLVATGNRIESHDDADPKTGRWQSDVPFAVAGFNLGEYKMETAGTDKPKIHLYANRLLEDAILSRLHQTTSNPPVLLPPIFQLPSVDLGTVERALPPPPPSPAAVLKRLGGEVFDSIQFFEKLNGPFPFDHLDVSQIPGSFGQGWPGLVYLSTFVFLPTDVQARAGMGARAQAQARELMPFHEVAHQWWGNVVGTETYRDAWIEEGMANYLSLLYADSKKPGEHRMTTWLEHFRTLLTMKAQGSNETAEEAGPLSLGFRLSSSRTPDAYETVIYGKGTWVIHMVHEMLREPAAKDPDARFRDLLHSLLTEHRFQTLSTLDFQHAVEQQMTPEMDLEGTHSMDWFFDQWVRGTGIPHYKVEFQVKPRGQEFLVIGKLIQSGVGEIFTAAVPLYAARAGAKPGRLGVVVTSGSETRFHFVTRVRPARLLIDPHLTLLCRTE
ncbi:MAG: M1 family aminopeptidase [Candidatus Acidiferrales bacterium]